MMNTPANASLTQPSTSSSTISLTALESAINFWRAKNPSVGDEHRLCEQAAALATPYALMILGRLNEISIVSLSNKAQDAYVTWSQSTR